MSTLYPGRGRGIGLPTNPYVEFRKFLVWKNDDYTGLNWFDSSSHTSVTRLSATHFGWFYLRFHGRRSHVCRSTFLLSLRHIWSRFHFVAVDHFSRDHRRQHLECFWKPNRTLFYLYLALWHCYGSRLSIYSAFTILRTDLYESLDNHCGKLWICLFYECFQRLTKKCYKILDNTQYSIKKFRWKKI